MLQKPEWAAAWWATWLICRLYLAFTMSNSNIYPFISLQGCSWIGGNERMHKVKLRLVYLIFLLKWFRLNDLLDVCRNWKSKMNCCMKQRLYWRNNLQDLTQRKKGLVSKCAISNSGSQHGTDNKPTFLRAQNPFHTTLEEFENAGFTL